MDLIIRHDRKEAQEKMKLIISKMKPTFQD